MINDIILVNKKGKQVGTRKKMEVHKSGKMHRAFSVFVFNSNGELLLQKRAKDKYHSGGLWTNTCCGHPNPGEGINEAATRRLGEEMGFSCDLKILFSFCYFAELDNGMIENEYDYVLSGEFNGKPSPNPAEAESWQWINRSNLEKDMAKNPKKYTHWFKIAAERLDEIVRRSKK